MAVLAASLGSALVSCDRPDWTIGPGGFTSGGSSVSTGGTSPGAAASGGSGGTATPCYLERVQGAMPIFAEQVVNPRFPASRELYALVTDEEAEALRAGAPLVPAPGQPPMTPVVVQLLESLLPTATPAQRPLIQTLASRLQSTRSTWPHPWALRLVDHPATQHLNPVRIVLRERAWLGRVVDGSLAVLDLHNELVETDAALAEPERIAVVFFPTYQGASAPSVGQCNTGYRSFALGGVEMVEEWSLATEEISDRLEQDLALLRQLLSVVRNCSAVDHGSSFNAETACTTWASFNAHSEYTAYQWALAHPEELYEPSTQNLVNLIEALEGDRFEPDPFISAMGAGGDGAAGDSGSAGEGGAAAGGVGGVAGVGGT